MPDRLRLSTRHRRVLEALLREHLPDVEVWAYGSRVSGLGHDGSDLDLVLRGPGLDKIPFDRLLDFEEAVRESTIPFLVEARDWARLPERFHREIEREYVAVVGAASSPWTKPPEHRERPSADASPVECRGDFVHGLPAPSRPRKSSDRSSRQPRTRITNPAPSPRSATRCSRG